MASRGLFRKNIEPRCVYCRHARALDSQRVLCKRRGIVSAAHHCRAFRYDPLRRIPPKPAVFRKQYTNADFSLEDPDEI